MTHKVCCFVLHFGSLQAKAHLYFAHSLLLAAFLVLGLLLGLFSSFIRAFFSRSAAEWAADRAASKLSFSSS